MTRFELINAIIDDTSITMSEKSLLVALWRFSDSNNYSYPSADTLMKAASIGSNNTFLKVRKSLVEKGYIKYNSRQNKTCEYYLTFNSAKMHLCKNDSADLIVNSAKVIPFTGADVNHEQNKEHNNKQNNNINIPAHFYYDWMNEMSIEFIS